jgi:hypothetical protein
VTANNLIINLLAALLSPEWPVERLAEATAPRPASMALADHPRVLLPIIFYNLVQHLVAGCADLILSRVKADP